MLKVAAREKRVWRPGAGLTQSLFEFYKQRIDVCKQHGLFVVQFCVIKLVYCQAELVEAGLQSKSGLFSNAATFRFSHRILQAQADSF